MLAVDVATVDVPTVDLLGVLERLAPVLGFLVAATVLADLCDAAGLFDVLAGRASELARGRTPVLFGLLVVLATATTILLGLDTTVVLLTPVVLAMCAQLQISPIPFALATLALANTTSLLLPVSNLTNLLAIGRLGESPAQFASRMWLATLVAVVGTTAVIVARHWKSLQGGYTTAPRHGVNDRVLLAAASIACVGFAVMVLAGVDVTWAAVAAATFVALPALARRCEAFSIAMVPWKLVLGVFVLYLVVDTAGRHGLSSAMTTVAGTGEQPLDLLRIAGVASLGANAINNLPAYLALEPAAGHSPQRLLALLLGVNTGCMVTPWGSLATLLWAARCRSRQVEVPVRQVVTTGALLLPAVLLPTVLTLRR